MKFIDRSKLLQQLVPLLLTGVILTGLVIILFYYIRILNWLPSREKVILVVRPVDVLVGITIYLKTSIDFAIFMGRLMSSNPGWKNRIAIEIGTALGNALGTLLVIILWMIFKEVEWLLALMVFFAALVLFELAYGGLEHFSNWEGQGKVKQFLYQNLYNFLYLINRLTKPFLTRVLPDLGEKLRGKEGLSWKGLFSFAISIPFILGLDDFAGYVPLFSVINIFGFSLGVFAAHTILNIGLFISPSRTIAAVKNEYVSFAGTIAFIGLAFYGLIEVIRVVLHLI